MRAKRGKGDLSQYRSTKESAPKVPNSAAQAEGLGIRRTIANVALKSKPTNPTTLERHVWHEDE